MATTKSDKHNNNVVSANNVEEKVISDSKQVSDMMAFFYLSTSVETFKKFATKVDGYGFSEEEFSEWEKDNSRALDDINTETITSVKVYIQPAPEDRETADKDERKSRVYSYTQRDANGNVDDNLSGVWYTYWVDVTSANEIKRSFDSWRRFNADKIAGADRAVKRMVNGILKGDVSGISRDDLIKALASLQK